MTKPNDVQAQPLLRDPTARVEQVPVHVIARARKGAQHRREHPARHGAMLRRDAIAPLVSSLYRTPAAVELDERRHVFEEERLGLADGEHAHTLGVQLTCDERGEAPW